MGAERLSRKEVRGNSSIRSSCPMEAPLPPPRKDPTPFTSPLLLSDEQIVAMGINQSDAEMFRRKQAAFGINTWYDQLKEHTFRIPLEFEEGEAMLKKHYAKYSHAPTTTPEELERADALLANVEARIAAALAGFPSGVFIKLNTRSPKDMAVENDNDPEIVALVEAELAPTPVGQRTQDAVCNAYLGQYLRVTTAAHAMKLLLGSGRIAEDLRKMIPFGKKFFDTCLILREWNEEAPNRIAYEFRGFVGKNRLNALSQYFCFIHFPELVANKAALGKQIEDFFYTISDKIKHESYVIDFLVLRDRILIIELNPFHNGAGGALFSWAKHRELFLNGPFTFKVQEEPNPEEGRHILSKRWTRVIDCPPDSAAAASPPSPPASDEPAAASGWTYYCTLV